MAPELAPVLLEEGQQVVGERADAAAHLGHGGVGGRGQGEGQAQGASGGERSPVGRVDRQEGEHAADLGVGLTIRQELVDDVHHAAEHGGADGLALLLVGGACPHLVEGLRRLPDVEPSDGPGRCIGPAGHLGHAQHGLEAEGLAQVPEQPVGVAVEQQGRLAGRPDGGGLHFGLVDGAGGEAEVVEDLRGDGELYGTGQLEAEAAHELVGRGHPPDEVVLLEAQHPHAPAGHDRGGGKSVVACTDDDGVVVRHAGHRSAAPSAGEGS